MNLLEIYRSTIAISNHFGETLLEQNLAYDQMFWRVMDLTNFAIDTNPDGMFDFHRETTCFEPVWFCRECKKNNVCKFQKEEFIRRLHQANDEAMEQANEEAIFANASCSLNEIGICSFCDYCIRN